MGYRVLVVGSGSIGKRHIRSLIKLEIQQIAVLRSQFGNKSTLPDDLNNSVIQFFTEEDALNWLPTHMVISNPTHLHLPFLLKGLDKGISCFVEKPVLDSFEIIENNEELMNRLLSEDAFVGFNLRFRGIFMKIKEILEAGQLGKIFFACLEVGHYLPNWHPDEDYRERYSARREMGGGVLRTLSHELDLVNYFFGKFINLFATVEKLSSLEIDVDDCVNITATAEKCKRIGIHLDYLNPYPTRKGRIIGENGSLEYDYFKNHISINYYNKSKSTEFSIEEDNQLQYDRQMEHFLNGDESIACSLREGIETDRIIYLCEKSNNLNRVLNV